MRKVFIAIAIICTLCTTFGIAQNERVVQVKPDILDKYSNKKLLEIYNITSKKLDKAESEKDSMQNVISVLEVEIEMSKDKDEIIAKQRNIIERQKGVIAEQKVTIREQKKELEEKDRIIAEKDKLIEKLREEKEEIKREAFKREQVIKARLDSLKEEFVVMKIDIKTLQEDSRVNKQKLKEADEEIQKKVKEITTLTAEADAFAAITERINICYDTWANKGIIIWSSEPYGIESSKRHIMHRAKKLTIDQVHYQSGNTSPEKIEMLFRLLEDGKVVAEEKYFVKKDSNLDKYQNGVLISGYKGGKTFNLKGFRNTDIDLKLKGNFLYDFEIINQNQNNPDKAMVGMGTFIFESNRQGRNR